MNIKKIMKEQGGMQLIKTYAYNHVLAYAIFCFLMLPKSIKGFELLRECINLRIFEKIKKRYKYAIIKYSRCEVSSVKTKPKLIWFCWLQGMKTAPVLVHSCYKSIKENCPEYDVHIITSENFTSYADIPEYIIEKWKMGLISHAHFSDILRTSLLVQNGGTWIDSTVFLTNHIPLDIESAPLFLFRTYKPGSNGKATTLSSWFLSSVPNNPVLLLTQKLLYEYWKSHNKLCDYFLFHIFLQISLECLSENVKYIPKYTNENPHFMLFELGNTFIEEKWDSITSQSFCHKLTNKLSEETMQKEKTFYKFITRK